MSRNYSEYSVISIDYKHSCCSTFYLVHNTTTYRQVTAVQRIHHLTITCRLVSAFKLVKETSFKWQCSLGSAPKIEQRKSAENYQTFLMKCIFLPVLSFTSMKLSDVTWNVIKILACF